MLPLCIESWPKKTQYNQPATNFIGRRTIRTPLHESDLLWGRPIPRKPNAVKILRTLPVYPKFQ